MGSIFLVSVIGSSLSSTAEYIVPELPELPKPPCSTEICIKDRITYYAKLYNVSEKTMNWLVKCESSYRPSATNITEREFSVGVAQINLMAHTSITEAMARDVDYSLNFMASHLSLGHHDMWRNCYRLATSPSQ